MEWWRQGCFCLRSLTQFGLVTFVVTFVEFGHSRKGGEKGLRASLRSPLD